MRQKNFQKSVKLLIGSILFACLFVYFIIYRYNTLVATHSDLLETEQHNQKASEDEKARLVRFTEEKNNQILHYNNKLAQLQTRLDQVIPF